MTQGGGAPGHSTPYRRFRGFAARLDPVPDLRHRPGPKPTAYQMAEGTNLKLQEKGLGAGLAGRL